MNPNRRTRRLAIDGFSFCCDVTTLYSRLALLLFFRTEYTSDHHQYSIQSATMSAEKGKTNELASTKSPIVNTSSEQSKPSLAPPAPATSPTDNNNDEPGGLFGYILNRKKNSSNTNIHPTTGINKDETSKQRQSSQRLKYHKFANAGGSCYLGPLDGSDSEDDEPGSSFFGRSNVISPPPIFDTPSVHASAGRGSSWFDRFQAENVAAKKDEIGSSMQRQTVAAGKDASSWMSQAWKSSMDAAERIYATSSSAYPSESGTNNATSDTSSWKWVPSSLSTTVSDTISSVSAYAPSHWIIFGTQPFSNNSDNNSEPINTNNEPSAATNRISTLAFLPKMASKFEFATKRRNPFQAVIGRDTDYLLSPNTPYWGSTGNMFSLSSWISWIVNSHINKPISNGIEGESSEGGGMLHNFMTRKKSQPSEASVQAVKNLLVLVQQQIDESQPSSSNQSPQSSSHSSTSLNYASSGNEKNGDGDTPQQTIPIQSKPSFPSIELPDFEHDTTAKLSSAETHQTLSFDSCPSSVGPSPHLSPVRSSPVRGIEHEESEHKPPSQGDSNQALHAEMAARLAEGTLRAYRDLVLDEATDLHASLHFWTRRWERPFLGWLEAGPSVWFSEEGYSPYTAGKKVSQIQAVIARRCAAIGEIQQQLLRSPATSGVGEWGMLGRGEWTAVIGEVGGLDGTGLERAHDSIINPSPTNKRSKRRFGFDKPMRIFSHPTHVGKNVRNAPGGNIVVDQNAQAIWCIDAMRVIRDQLYRAGR